MHSIKDFNILPKKDSSSSLLKAREGVYVAPNWDLILGIEEWKERGWREWRFRIHSQLGKDSPELALSIIGKMKN